MTLTDCPGQINIALTTTERAYLRKNMLMIPAQHNNCTILRYLWFFFYWRRDESYNFIYTLVEMKYIGTEQGCFAYFSLETHHLWEIETIQQVPHGGSSPQVVHPSLLCLSCISLCQWNKSGRGQNALVTSNSTSFTDSIISWNQYVLWLRQYSGCGPMQCCYHYLVLQWSTLNLCIQLCIVFILLDFYK